MIDNLESEKMEVNHHEENEFTPNVNVQAEEAAQEVPQAEENAQAQDSLENAHEDLHHTEEEVLSKEDEAHISSLTREELLEKLRSLVDGNKFQTTKSLVAVLKLNFGEKTKQLKQDLLAKFIEDGGDKKDFQYVEDEISKEFFKWNTVIRDFYKKQKEDLEKLWNENLAKKKEVLEQLRLLIDSDQPLKAIYDEFHALQETWKKIGQIPRAETNSLWQSYHFLQEKFFDKVKIFNDLRALDQKKNLEKKIILCEKAESLLLDKSINNSFKLLQQYHEEWKEIGPVPIEQKDEIWERFKNISDTINQNRREFYEQQQAELEKNLLAKQALCDELEAEITKEFTSANQWIQATNKINDLMALWKKIGRVPSQVNEEIWNKFRGSMNSFYESKKEFFDKIGSEYADNYNLKVDLCAKAENIANTRVDWRAATVDLLALQEQWKKVGHVARKDADKLWKRFRGACDLFFDKKAAQHKDAKEKELANLKAKQELIESVKEAPFTEDKAHNLNLIREIQRKWTEIGFVPNSEKDAIYKSFREAIDAQMKVLGLPSNDFSTTKGMIARLTEVNESPNDPTFTSREMSQLSAKINQLKEDITLWENNIGFFSKSKSADVLRIEFENKIQKAKKDLALLESKFKILKQS